MYKYKYASLIYTPLPEFVLIGLSKLIDVAGEVPDNVPILEIVLVLTFIPSLTNIAVLLLESINCGVVPCNSAPV